MEITLLDITRGGYNGKKLEIQYHLKLKFDDEVINFYIHPESSTEMQLDHDNPLSKIVIEPDLSILNEMNIGRDIINEKFRIILNSMKIYNKYKSVWASV